MLKENLEKVEENIQAACDRAGRKRDEVTLIAVSKTKPPHMLQEAYDLGVRIFGENKVQEIREKYEVLPKDIDWHMIGHLQRNKVKYIVDKVARLFFTTPFFDIFIDLRVERISRTHPRMQIFCSYD